MIRLKFADVIYTDDGCFTSYDDGTVWGAQPHDTHHYHVIAHRLGYGDDILGYCREHEVAHHVACEWFFGSPSPIIWSLAHGEPINPQYAVFEEMAAQSLQRFVRAGERPIIADVDWDGLRNRMLEVLQ